MHDGIIGLRVYHVAAIGGAKENFKKAVHPNSLMLTV